MHRASILRTRPPEVQTSVVKKSAAAREDQCAFKKVFQAIFGLRSGAGLRPRRRSMLRMVVGAMTCPRTAGGLSSSREAGEAAWRGPREFVQHSLAGVGRQRS